MSNSFKLLTNSEICILDKKAWQVKILLLKIAEKSNDNYC